MLSAAGTALALRRRAWHAPGCSLVVRVPDGIAHRRCECARSAGCISATFMSHPRSMEHVHPYDALNETLTNVLRLMIFGKFQHAGRRPSIKDHDV